MLGDSSTSGLVSSSGGGGGDASAAVAQAASSHDVGVGAGSNSGEDDRIITNNNNNNNNTKGEVFQPVIEEALAEIEGCGKRLLSFGRYGLIWRHLEMQVLKVHCGIKFPGNTN